MASRDQRKTRGATSAPHRLGVRALAVETHENWLEGARYLNMQHLTEHQKEAVRQAA